MVNTIVRCRRIYEIDTRPSTWVSVSDENKDQFWLFRVIPNLQYNKVVAVLTFCSLSVHTSCVCVHTSCALVHGQPGRRCPTCTRIISSGWQRFHKNYSREIPGKSVSVFKHARILRMFVSNMRRICACLD